MKKNYNFTIVRNKILNSCMKYKILTTLAFVIIILNLISCKKDETVIPPTITSFDPTEGIAGTIVTIQGANFNNEISKNIVTIGGVSSTVTDATVTQLKVIVPANPKSGKIILTINGATGTSGDNFTVLSQPAITSFDPVSGKAGDIVTIKGTGFSTDPAKNIVKFKDGVAQVTTASSTSLTAVVPPNALKGQIYVETLGGSTLSVTEFSMLATVDSFSPSSGPLGTRITIKGKGLGNNYAVVFPTSTGQADGAVLSYNGTELIVVAPINTLPNKFSLVNRGGGSDSFEVGSFTLTDSPPAELTSYPGPIKSFDLSGFAINDQLFFGLGSNDQNAFTSDFWKYDVSTNAWSQVANFPGGGRIKATSFAINGTGFICGGWASVSGVSTKMKDVWDYNPTTGQWHQRKDFPDELGEGTASFVIGNFAYVTVGNKFWQYDPINDNWISKADFPGKAVIGAAGFSLNGLGYISGGNGTNIGDGLSTWYYDPAKDTWKKEFFLTPFFDNFDRCHGFSINGVGYVAKGSRLFQFVPVPYYGSLPATGVWVQVQTMPDILTPLPGSGGGSTVRNANQGLYLATKTKAYVWYGSDKFWVFTPPN